MSQYSAVFSSGVNSAHFAPASIAIFAIVIRLATVIFFTVLPVNSSALYVAPSAPRSPIRRRMISLDITFSGSSPSITILIVSGTLIHIVPVPRILAISVYPIPEEKAPTHP